MTGHGPGRVGRLGTGLAVLVLAAGVLVAGLRLSPAQATALPQVQVTPPATAVTLACPGTLELPEGAGTTKGDSAFDPVPVSPVTTASVLSVGADAGAVSVRRPAGPQVATVRAGGGSTDPAHSSALLVRADPGPAGVTTVTASSSTLTTAGDLRGLAGASCGTASSDVWLVGGSTADGGTARLVLINPGATAAAVTWQVWGPIGAVDLTRTQAVLGPGASTVVDLAAVAGEQRALVVRVQSTGGQVWAHLQDDAVNGYTAAGTDLVVAGAGPATRQTVPGLLVDASQVGGTGQPTLRLLVPGDRGATAHVTLLGGDGPVDLPGAQSIALTAGDVLDLPLGGLAAGRYTVVVDADVPVVAAATFSRVGSTGDLDTVPRIDRAVSVATTGGAGTVALPAGTDDTLVVGAVATGSDPAADVTATGTVRVLGRSGQVLAQHTLTVDAGTTGAWTLAELMAGAATVDAVGVQVLPSAGQAATLSTLSWALVAQVSQADGALVTLLDPVPPAAGGGSVAVREERGAG